MSCIFDMTSRRHTFKIGPWGNFTKSLKLLYFKSDYAKTRPDCSSCNYASIETICSSVRWLHVSVPSACDVSSWSIIHSYLYFCCAVILLTFCSLASSTSSFFRCSRRSQNSFIQTVPNCWRFLNRIDNINTNRPSWACRLRAGRLPRPTSLYVPT